MSEQSTSKLQLSQVIKQLRSELTKAAQEGDGEDIRFTVEDIELELDITIEEQAKGTLSAFYVITSKVEAMKKNLATQKLKVKLKPEKIKVNKITGEQTIEPCKVAGEVDD